MTITVGPTVVYDGTAETAPAVGRRYVYVDPRDSSPAVHIATAWTGEREFFPIGFAWAYVEVLP